jgi:hypothetical protein
VKASGTHGRQSRVSAWLADEEGFGVLSRAFGRRY